MTHSTSVFSPRSTWPAGCPAYPRCPWWSPEPVQPLGPRSASTRTPGSADGLTTGRWCSERPIDMGFPEHWNKITRWITAWNILIFLNTYIHRYTHIYIHTLYIHIPTHIYIHYIYIHCTHTHTLIICRETIRQTVIQTDRQTNRQRGRSVWGRTYFLLEKNI